MKHEALSALAIVLASLAPAACDARLAADASEVRSMLPDVPRRADRCSIGGPPARYRLDGLQPSKGYEVRASFPGTNPVRMRLWLESGGGSAQQWRSGNVSGGGRKLLDAEKVMFATDGEGRVVADGGALREAHVLLSAEPWGRWVRPEAAPTELTYDIVLERSTLGVPHSAMPLLGAAVALVLAAAAAVPWWTGSAVPALLRWLHRSGAAVAAGQPAAQPRQRRSARITPARAKRLQHT